MWLYFHLFLGEFGFHCHSQELGQKKLSQHANLRTCHYCGKVGSAPAFCLLFYNWSSTLSHTSSGLPKQELARHPRENPHWREALRMPVLQQGTAIFCIRLFARASCFLTYAVLLTEIKSRKTREITLQRLGSQEAPRMRALWPGLDTTHG